MPLKGLPMIVHETGIVCDPRTLRKALHKFVNIPKIMIGGAIAVNVKGPLIIFEKGKGMTNAKGNVDSNSYINHVLPKLVEFYNGV